MTTKTEVFEKWTKKSKEVLEGKTIVEVRYMNDQEMEDIGWSSRPIVFFLNDGTYCTLSQDDEGNDGGVLFYNENGVLPTLR
jgi:predicted ribosome-associated RNA-binding protein Tma20